MPLLSKLPKALGQALDINKTTDIFSDYYQGQPIPEEVLYRAEKTARKISPFGGPESRLPTQPKPEGYDEYELQEKAKEDAEKSEPRHLGVASMESLIRCL